MTSGSVRLSSRLVGAEIFRVELQRDRDAVRVVPVGELDIATVGQVDQLLRELGAAGVRSIVCDLRRLEFVDCSGARLLLECGAVPVTRAGGWSSSGVGEDRTVFALTGIDRRLEFIEASAAGCDDVAA